MALCLTVTSRYCVERLDGSRWLLARELPSTYPTPCCKKIRVPQKIRVLHSGTLSETLDLENFATFKSVVLSTKLVDGRACGSRLRQSTRRCWTHIVYCTTVYSNRLTPLLRFVVDLLYNFFLQFCGSWQDFDWHSASRGPSSAAELPVFNNRQQLVQFVASFLTLLFHVGVTVLGKLFTPIVPLFTKQQNW